MYWDVHAIAVSIKRVLKELLFIVFLNLQVSQCARNFCILFFLKILSGISKAPVSTGRDVDNPRDFWLLLRNPLVTTANS